MRSTVVSCAFLFLLGLPVGCGGDDDGGGAEPASFVGVPWVLTAGLDVDGWESVAPSATFTDTTLGGSTGCNRFTASYTVDGDSIEIGTIAATLMACAPPADAVERAYVDALERVTGWSSDSTELVLLDEDGAELLRYGTATPAGAWQATAIQTGVALASPLPGTEITATFTDDGRLTGSAGCNSYSTSYTTDQGGIEIGPPASTKKACPTPAGVMEQEAAYLAALPTAVSYRVEGGSLSLLSADGTYVTSYTRAANP